MNNKVHTVERLEFDGDFLILHVDKQCFEIRISSISDRLARASQASRRFYRVSPSGYGIHWPELDEDLTVDGLIRAAEPSAYPTQNLPAAQLREGEK